MYVIYAKTTKDWYIHVMAIDWTNIFRSYKGKWVALKDDERTVVGSGKTLKQALVSAQKKGYEQPILYRVPTKLMLRVGQA